MSPSHPSYEVEDGDTRIRISIWMYSGAAAAVILLVTLVMIIILACVLQPRRSKKAVYKEQTNGCSQVYTGTEQRMYVQVNSQYI